MDLTITADEVLAELQQLAPETVDRAALRVANRKLAARVAELETPADPPNVP